MIANCKYTAGRLSAETAGAAGNNALRRTEYAYGWLDKVMNVFENGKLSASFDYGIDGQLSSRVDASGKSESFTWDGLALIKRDSTNFVNESAVTGGNPILAFGKDSSKVLFEDMLGSSMGSVENGKFNAINRTAFGEPLSNSRTSELSNFSSDFFTGKPQVEGLGYAFLFRNYRAEQGKWQTADPIALVLSIPEKEILTLQSRFMADLGYPDGWNNFTYCRNWVNIAVDVQGCLTFVGSDNEIGAYDNPDVATGYATEDLVRATGLAHQSDAMANARSKIVTYANAHYSGWSYIMYEEPTMVAVHYMHSPVDGLWYWSSITLYLLGNIYE